MLEPELVKLTLGLTGLVTLATVYAGFSAQDGGKSSGRGRDEHFRSFQRAYLMVFLPAAMADWLQGPFVYALYDAYGFLPGDNAVLFTVGFGSSAVFGTVIGSLADRFGRRRFAALYCLLYGASCITKHFNSFAWLVVGRVTGGIATSLLFSVFDSWLVSEHSRRGFDPDLLGATFALATFGNSVAAITAGELGQLAADAVEFTRLGTSAVHYGGVCTPFDVAFCFLLLALMAMTVLWPENYGPGSSSGSTIGALGAAMRVVMAQPQVLYCGLVCAFFEASMFIFVFMWTPALTEESQPKPPVGHIFACFMIMAMLGSRLFALQTARWSVEELGRGVLFLAALSHLLPVLTSNTTLRFASFLLFELCVGLYFPMIGTMKGNIVPEESRATIYNLYRLPLNVIVVGTLATKVRMHTAFALTTTLLLLAVYFQTRLMHHKTMAPYRPVGIDTEFGLEDDEPLGEIIDGIGGPGDELTSVVGHSS